MLEISKNSPKTSDSGLEKRFHPLSVEFSKWLVGRWVSGITTIIEPEQSKAGRGFLWEFGLQLY